MKAINLITISAVLFCACQKNMSGTTTAALQATTSNAEAAGLTVITSPYWDSVFTRYGNGWTGGDGAYSLRLPDGRSLWLWGDSFLDTVFSNRTRPVQGFIHNQMVTTDSLGGNFTTYFGGTKASPKAYFEASNANQYYWPTSAFVNQQKNKVYVMMVKIKPATGGFKIVGTDVATLDYPSLKIKGMKKFYVGDFIDWSSTTMDNGDGYIYLYGVEGTKYNKYIHVARTSAVNPFQTVEYFDSTNWTTDIAKSARVQGGVSESFSVFKNNGGYYLVSQANLLSEDIYIWNAVSPTGPFYNKRFLYTTPELTNSTWTYNATAHTELSKDGKLLIGYCMNTNTTAQLYNNVDTYRPYFIEVSGWQ